MRKFLKNQIDAKTEKNLLVRLEYLQIKKH